MIKIAFSTTKSLLIDWIMTDEKINIKKVASCGPGTECRFISLVRCAKPMIFITFNWLEWYQMGETTLNIYELY